MSKKTTRRESPRRKAVAKVEAAQPVVYVGLVSDSDQLLVGTAYDALGAAIDALAQLVRARVKTTPAPSTVTAPCFQSTAGQLLDGGAPYWLSKIAEVRYSMRTLARQRPRK
jgi:hypothetical protein